MHMTVEEAEKWYEEYKKEYVINDEKLEPI